MDGEVRGEGEILIENGGGGGGGGYLVIEEATKSTIRKDFGMRISDYGGRRMGGRGGGGGGGRGGYELCPTPNADHTEVVSSGVVQDIGRKACLVLNRRRQGEEGGDRNSCYSICKTAG